MISTLSTGILLFIAAVLVIYLVILYNRIVDYDQSAKSAMSSIYVELQKRADLIPEVISSVKGFVRHEDQLLKRLTELRTKINAADKSREALLQLDKDFFMSLFAVAEAYPNLRSSETFLKLQNVLESTENSIAASRHIYNSNVDYFNSLIHSFPAVIVAGMFGYAEKEYLKFEEAIETRVGVPSDFNS